MSYRQNHLLQSLFIKVFMSSMCSKTHCQILFLSIRLFKNKSVAIIIIFSSFNAHLLELNGRLFNVMHLSYILTGTINRPLLFSIFFIEALRVFYGEKYFRKILLTFQYMT